MVTSNPDIPNLPNTAEVGTQLSTGPARPIVLFPVRLETRFFPQADGIPSCACASTQIRRILIRTSRG
jgi:hypothetical protein